MLAAHISVHQTAEKQAKDGWPICPVMPAVAAVLVAVHSPSLTSYTIR